VVKLHLLLGATVLAVAGLKHMYKWQQTSLT
jgi:hypothetical protein